MSINIESARPDDFLNIAALDRIAWLHTGEPFIADGEHVWRVWCEYATVLLARHETGDLESSQDAAGAAVYFPTSAGENFLHKIMVHPSLRGRGVGSELMREAIRRSTQPLLLTVDPANTAAVKLYRNFGFDVRDHVEGYYRPHENRYLMVHPGSHQS